MGHSNQSSDRSSLEPWWHHEEDSFRIKGQLSSRFQSFDEVEFHRPAMLCTSQGQQTAKAAVFWMSATQTLNQVVEMKFQNLVVPATMRRHFVPEPMLRDTVKYRLSNWQFDRMQCIDASNIHRRCLSTEDDYAGINNCNRNESLQGRHHPQP